MTTSYPTPAPASIAEEDRQVQEILADPDAYFENAYKRALLEAAQADDEDRPVGRTHPINWSTGQGDTL